MNTVQVAKDFIRLLEEQVSIINALNSYTTSLKKLEEQFSIPDTWSSLGLIAPPSIEFKQVLTHKQRQIVEELSKLR